MSSSRRGVQVDRNEHVLLQPIGFGLPDVLADLLVELRPRLPRPVLGELTHHALAGAGDQQISSRVPVFRFTWTNALR